MTTDWVVWSYEHDAWWGANNSGYVSSLLLAGLYTEAAAKEIERGANGSRQRKSEEARSLAQAMIGERERWGRRGPMVMDRVEADMRYMQQLDESYAAADFADEQYPDRTILKFAFPSGFGVSAELRATLDQAFDNQPART